MIAKAVKGRGFRGALEYDLEREKGHMIDSNMSGETPRELAAEFGAIRKLRPTLNRAVLHVSLSAAPGEELTDDQWREIGQRYLSGMGLDDNQYIMTRHTDTDHEHIHILANRITFAGATVSDSQDYKRQEALMREIEKEYNLKAVVPSKDAERRASTKNEIEKSIRTGQPSTRSQLQQLCAAAANDCPSVSEYAKRLDAVGVAVVPVYQGNGAKLSGLSYQLDGEVMKGSDLGKAYSPMGLSKRGVTYEQARDFEAIRGIGERAANSNDQQTTGRPGPAPGGHDRADSSSRDVDRGDTAAATKGLEAVRPGRLGGDLERSDSGGGRGGLVAVPQPADARPSSDRARDSGASTSIAPAGRDPAGTAEAKEPVNEQQARHRAAVAAILAGETKTPAPVAPALERPEAPERPKAQPKAPERPKGTASRSPALVGREFAELASKREFGQLGYRDNNDGWRFDTPAPLRAKVDDYNKLPKDQRPAALAKIAADPDADGWLQQRAREIKQSRGR